MLSYAQVREWAATHLHEDPDDAVLTTLFLRWANDAVGEIAAAHRWQWLEGETTLTLGADGSNDDDTGGGITYFPYYIQDILSLWPADRGYREQVQIIGAWELDALQPNTATGQIADYLALWGYYNTANDVTSAGTVTATASGGSSADGAQVVIEGINNSTGLEHRETLTLSSGTATSSASWKSGPDGVRRIYVVDSSIGGTGEPTEANVGTVTITDAGSTTLEVINVAIGERQHEHLRGEISPSPGNSGASYVVRYYKRIRQLVNDDDIVEIPQEFEQTLFFGISRRLSEFRGNTQMATYYDTLMRKRIYELKLQQGRRPGRMRALRGLRHYHYRNPGRY